MLCIVIPCHNEAKRIDSEQFTKFMETYIDELLLFVDDGSTDKTLFILEKIKQEFPERVIIISTYKNVGKAEAVRFGFLKIINDFPKINTIGFLDADLSTALDEMITMNEILIHRNIVFVAASRIMKMGSEIIRKRHRHILGRFAATLIGYVIKLGFYDTQCGAKVMTKSAATIAFTDKFISNWLFDVEIILRLKKNYGNKVTELFFEYPVKQWIFQSGSKIKALEPIKLLWHLYKIHKKYNSKSLH